MYILYTIYSIKRYDADQVETEGLKSDADVAMFDFNKRSWRAFLKMMTLESFL